MGRVYRARDEVLRRHVALKVLHLAADASEAHHPTAHGDKLLLHEARAAASLVHANTVAVYDVGEVDGTPFIAMELVDGAPLRTLIGQPSIPLATRLRYLADIARALQAAHSRGILHRDVKPENVIIRIDGVVKVLDFGIARLLEPAHAEAHAPSTARERAAHAFETWARSGIAGTPRYMSPEQLEGAPLDARTDQFAWGVVAYELLTGSLPWGASSGPTGLPLFARIVNEEPAPEAPIRKAAPPAVADVVLRALSKRREQRFASMAEIVAALSPPSVRPEVRTRARLVPFEPDIEVYGPLIRAVVSAFGPFEAVAARFVAQFPISADDAWRSPAGDTAAECWVSKAQWLAAFDEIIAEVGGGVLFNTGLNVPTTAREWPQAGDIASALAMLDVVYHANHRRAGRVMWDAATGEMSEGIGHYRVSAEPGAKRIMVLCDNPYPCELDHGIITALARQYEATARVEHAPLGCRIIGGRACVYAVSWD